MIECDQSNDQQGEHLTGQTPNQAGHCLLTQRSVVQSRVTCKLTKD